MNNIIVQGNVCKDIELMKTSSDISVAKFTVAVTRPFKKDETDFIRVVAWRKKAEVIADYFHKGSRILLRGWLKVENYQNDDGKWVNTAEVQLDDFDFIDKKGASANTPVDPPADTKGMFEENAEITDKLPF